MTFDLSRRPSLLVLLALSAAALAGCLAEGPFGTATPGGDFGIMESTGSSESDDVLSDTGSPDDLSDDLYDDARAGSPAGTPPAVGGGGSLPEGDGAYGGWEDLGGAGGAQGQASTDSLASTEAPPQATQQGAGGDPEGKLAPTCDHPPCFFPDSVNMDEAARPVGSEILRGMPNIPANSGQIPAGQIPQGQF